MKETQTWYELVRHADGHAAVDGECYGIFPSRERADDVADYYSTIGVDLITRTVELAFNVEVRITG